MIAAKDMTTQQDGILQQQHQQKQQQRQYRSQLHIAKHTKIPYSYTLFSICHDLFVVDKQDGKMNELTTI